jgi:hypothetical protein
MTAARERPGLTRLYKYMPPPGGTPFALDNLQKILRAGEIRLSTPSLANDPYENRPAMTGHPSPAQIETILNRIVALRQDSDNVELQARRAELIVELENTKDSPERRLRLLEQYMPGFVSYFEKSIDVVGFVSLTEMANSMLMWAHYANNHTGVCIGWTVGEQQFPGNSFEIEYSEDRTEVGFGEFARADATIDLDILYRILHTKHTNWSYEKEWRFQGANVQSRKVLRGGEYFKYDRSAISDIIFGQKCSDQNIDIIRGLVGDLDPAPQFSRATVSETKFDFEIRPL